MEEQHEFNEELKVTKIDELEKDAEYYIRFYNTHYFISKNGLYKIESIYCYVYKIPTTTYVLK